MSKERSKKGRSMKLYEFAYIGDHSPTLHFFNSLQEDLKEKATLEDWADGYEVLQSQEAKRLEDGRFEYQFEVFGEYKNNTDMSVSTLSGIGLTKREQFAAIAMQGLISTMEATNGSMFPDTQNLKELVASASVKYADALIEELNKKGE